jgi:AraC-like DNA-binding protein
VKRDSVSVAFVREALRALAARGIDAAPVLAAAGVQPALIGTDSARISAQAFGRLWLGIAEALDDEFFGQDSRRLKVGSFATLCHLTLHTRDLREALTRGSRLLNLLLDDTRIELVLDRPQAVIRFVHTGAPVPLFAHETLFVMLHGLMCWLIGRRVGISQARFAYPRPARAEEYAAIYSRQLSFDAAVTEFEFNAVDLAAPVVQTEHSARAFLRQAPGNFVVKYKNPDSAAAYIRQRLRERSPETWPSFETCAEELGLSLSTLRRRLRGEGTSYRALKDHVRRDMALHQLTQTRRSVADIATQLGFAEASAFHRAFRQWTGVSPGDYRAATRATLAKPEQDG